MNILVIDDEISIINLIKMNLQLEGFNVLTSLMGMEGIEKFKKQKPDLVILDVMLPDISGHDVIQKMQKINNDIPIIMLTAKSQINDRLLGLQLGADDYITKPFNSTELILRIKAILKRINKKEKSNCNIIEKGILKVFKDERRVFINEKEISLTYKEFDSILLMIENSNKVFTREQLLNKVWGYDFEGNTRAVDILIQRLRKKIYPYSEVIKTVYGVGYKLEL
ncbi:response regulator transcription factor [Haloimpatiens sp. FM7330]|uniref:response regulator transcription factor n=1 Tax=Haloimpatiens sp. FM7330 TaxID=3298610 RepID=UPI0036351C58